MVDVPRRLRAMLCALVLAAALPAALATTAAAGQPTGSATSTPAVVGGQRVPIENYPWVVYLATSNGFQFCGGTLVASNKVLTAAHCATVYQPGDMHVVAGREDKNSNSGVVADVSSVWVEPDYHSADSGDDVAVLTLSESVPYQSLRLAGAGDEGLYAAGTTSDILGWGNTSENGSASEYLLHATVPLTSDDTCGRAYGAYDKNKMVCAGYDKGGVDTCQGDSGGPLEAGGALIGVVSFGDGCARPGKPGVYSRVITYHDQIETQINS